MEVSMDTHPGTNTAHDISQIPPQQHLPGALDDDSKKMRSPDEGEGENGSGPGPGPGKNLVPVENNNDNNNDTPNHDTAISPPEPAAENRCRGGSTSDHNPGGSAVRVEVVVPGLGGQPGAALSAIPSPNSAAATATSKDVEAERSMADAAPPAKKRKLSPASKEAKEQERLARQKEKEERERQKAEEKVKREEERRAKEEEKKKRDAEREEERRAKEEDKRKREAEREDERKRREEKKKAKDDEKAAREEEKSKKERAQMKLNSFFAKPKLPESPKKPPTSQNASSQVAPTLSDYHRQFPDFFLQSHTKLAPMHRFERDPETLRHMRAKVDACLKSSDGDTQEPQTLRPSEIFRLMPYKRRRGRQASSVKDILLKIQNLGGSLEADGASETSVKLQDTLRNIPMKSLKFGEDVRPPYQGTYSKPLPETSVSKLSRNPFHRGLPETNYDYDSEAEWEDPGEGEDLDSEEEEEASEEGDDDMEGFLDDEEDQPADGKRRLIVGDLEPVCTGLRWQENEIDSELQMYQAATISDAVTFPIDPFSTAYWPSKGSDPGRSRPSDSHGLPTSQRPGAPPPTGPDRLLGRPKRPFPPEHMAEFKEVVDGSELSKTGVVEVLKKRFPKVSKEVLKGTLDQVATRVGQREAEKKWVWR